MSMLVGRDLIARFRHNLDVRPIHYLGSKRRLLDAIDAVVLAQTKPSDLIADPFAGSGVVSARLAASRSVVASDIQEYSRVVTAAQLNGSVHSAEARRFADEAVRRLDTSGPSRDLIQFLDNWERSIYADPLRIDELEAMLESGSIEGLPGLASVLPDVAAVRRGVPVNESTVLLRYYAGPYFGYRQAASLDQLATQARRAPGPIRDTLVAAVISTASDVVSTVGNQFAQPRRLRDRAGVVKPATVASVLSARALDVPSRFLSWVRRYTGLLPANYPWEAKTCGFDDAIQPGIGIELVYADPPYTRDHYSRFYHVLETIARGDEPGATRVGHGSEPRTSRGIYRLDRHQSPFSIASMVDGAFELLFDRVSNAEARLVLSYSPRSAPTAARAVTRLALIERLLDQAQRHFRDVRVVSAGTLKHSKLNRRNLNAASDAEAELFVLAS